MAGPAPRLLDAERLAASADPAPATALRRAVRNVPRALSFLRSPEAGTSLPRYTAAARHLNTALTSYRGGSGRERLTLGDYVHGGLSEFSPRDLSLVAGGEAGTVFRGSHRHALLPRVERMRPRGIAISVNYRHQVLPAFELAGLLRRLLPGVPVFGGGGMFTSWRRALRTMDSAFLPFDGIGFGPGGGALAALAAGAGAPAHPYRAADAGGFPALVRKLSDRYGVQRFHLTDNAIPVGVLRSMASSGSLLRGLSWHGFARFERELLDPEFAASLAAAGCSMLQLGLESGSQPLLDRMGKGTRGADASGVLSDP